MGREKKIGKINSMSQSWCKRLFDIILALGGLILFSPFFILFSFLIWFEERGPVFYIQRRIGRGGEEFQMLKFRSMNMDSEEIPSSHIKKRKSQVNVTRIGKFLRETALDELPQLINILKGDMSFVGPRPLMLQEALELGPEAVSRRSTLRPGLTGLAQVSADKYVSNEEKLKYDLQYIVNQSLWLDIKLIFRSILITLQQKWEEESR